MKPNGTLKYRVGELEKDVNGLSADMKEVLTNHFPHVDTAIAELKTRVNTATAINVAAVIIGVLIAKYL